LHSGGIALGMVLAPVVANFGVGADFHDSAADGDFDLKGLNDSWDQLGGLGDGHLGKDGVVDLGQELDAVGLEALPDAEKAKVEAVGGHGLREVGDGLAVSGWVVGAAEELALATKGGHESWDSWIGTRKSFDDF